MKILHIAPSYWPAFSMGGPTQSVHLLNRYLVKKGVDITVFTTNAGLEKDTKIKLKKGTLTDGIKIFYFPYYGYIHWNFSFGLFWALANNVKNFDLIHITGVWNFPVSVAAFWARFYKIPYVISPRGSLMKKPLVKKSAFWKKIYLNLISKRDLKNAAFIHFTAELEKREYMESGLPFKKSAVVPNGFDIDNLRLEEKEANPKDFCLRFGIKPNQKIILFLSRISWKKGLDTLIPAFADVNKKYPQSVLVIVGGDDEGYAETVKLQIINYKLQDKVIFTGMLTGRDRGSAFKASSVFILPSYSENFGMAVVEAMAAEKPVVITKGVGISNEVESAGAGLVVEKEVNQVSEAILKVLNNPDLAKKMGEDGKKLVQEEFFSEKIAEKLMKEYNKIIYGEN